jgi:hypothetical protein
MSLTKLLSQEKTRMTDIAFGNAEQVAAAIHTLGPAPCARCSHDSEQPELLALHAPAIAFYREHSLLGLSDVLAPYAAAQVVYMVRCPRDWEATVGATKDEACQAWDALHGGYW